MSANELILAGASVAVTHLGRVPTERYGQAQIEWIAGEKASGARELMVGVTTIEVGGGSPMHRHPNCEEVMHILCGEIEQVVEGQPKFRMQVGDTVTVPRNLRHCALNAGSTPARG